ncbi:putative quinol monooxygenase [Dermatophilaceae bacterium Soc4.6]
MAGLHVVALISAKPGSETVVHEALTELAEATRQEAGCRAYDLFESAATPGTFVTVEEWADQAALDGHMASPHIAKALGAVGDALAAPPAIHPLTPA